MSASATRTAGQSEQTLFATNEATHLTEGSDTLSRSYGSPDLAATSMEQPPTVESDTIQILPATGDPSELENEGENEIAPLTRRLRCLFSTVTWPIVPLGSIVSLALIWVLYAAFVLDFRRSCSHPLHWYAVASLVLVAYAPQHSQVRSLLFRYSRERDGPIRPRRVRMYDQLFHTICLLYVYGGVSLLQTCRDDEFKGPDGATTSADGSDTPSNTCVATCPNLYQATSVYVTTLEMFTFALILPLLFLPCIYLWILRRATEDMDAFAQLHDRLEEEEALLAGEGVTAQELMDSLEHVQLVSRKKNEEDGMGRTGTEILLIPASYSEEQVSGERDGSNVKECCICMTEFDVQDEDDIESGISNGRASSSLSSQNRMLSPVTENVSTSLGHLGSGELSMVRTKCGHVFHRRCLAGWIGGRWEQNQQANDENRVRRRARRTCCPLCREDLKPGNDSHIT